MLDPNLVKILACPKCRQPLDYDQENNRLICSACRVYYIVEDDVPNLIPDKAKPIAN